jgi:hypothetical protein
MAQLPRYQRLGLQTRQPGNIDFADTREQARYAQTLSQQLDRMSEFAFKKSAEMAVERGQERVREEGALPTLEAIEAKGGPRGIAEKAAVEAANRIAVVEIETLAIADMQKLTVEADKNNMSMSAYQSAMLDINDGYKASLEMVDPVAAGVLGARLQGNTIKYETRYSEVVTQKAKAAWAKSVNEMFATRGQAILEDATMPGVTEEMLQEDANKLIEDAVVKGVGRKEAQKDVDIILKKAIKQNRFYLFNEASSIEVRRALVDQFKENPMPGYTYEADVKFSEELENRLNRDISDARSSIFNDVEKAKVVISATGKPPEGYSFPEDLAQGVFSEDEFTSLIEILENSQEDFDNRGSIYSMSPRNINEITEELYSEIDGQNPQEATRRFNDWITIVEQRETALETDAAAYLVKADESYANLMVGIERNLQNGNLDQVAAQIKTWSEISTKMYDLMGVEQDDRNLLPKSVSSMIVNQIRSYGEDLSANNLEAIKMGLGAAAPRFIQELSDSGLAQEVVVAMYVDNRPEVQTELVSLSEQTTEDLFKLSATGVKTKAKDALNKALISTNYGEAFTAGGRGKANDILLNQIQILEKLMASRIAGKDLTQADLEKHALKVIEDVIPWANQSVTVESLGSFVVPMDYDPDIIKKNLFRVKTVDELRKLGLDPLNDPALEGYANLEISLASAADTGMFYNTSDGRGVVLHYNINDNPVKSNLVISFDDLSLSREGPVLESAEEKEFLEQQGIAVDQEGGGVVTYSDPLLNPSAD